MPWVQRTLLTDFFDWICQLNCSVEKALAEKALFRLFIRLRKDSQI